MTRKKNKFFTFIFSTMFGAGQMYMGFMKQGVSIMALTFFIIALGSWTGIGTIFLTLPVLWFYSFFDSINKMTLPDRVFQTLEDNYILLPKQDGIQLKSFIAKYEKAIAIILILLGGMVLCENILDFIADQASRMNYNGLANFIYSLRWNGSKVLFSIVIILIGIKMIIGKKKELDREEPDNTADLKEVLPDNKELVSDIIPMDSDAADNPIRNNNNL